MRALINSDQSNSSSGESNSARKRYDQQLDKYSEYGYSSKEEVVELLDEDCLPNEQFENFEDSDFIQYNYWLGGIKPSKWKGYLMCACCLQQQCVTLKSNQGIVLLFGPKSRIQNAIWLYEQLLSDLISMSQTSWNNLPWSIKKNENQRSFKNSYCLAICLEFHAKEYDKAEIRKSRYSTNQEGLINIKDSIDIRSNQLAHNTYDISNRQTSVVSTSEVGLYMGSEDSGRISNRRMAANQKQLSGK